MQSYNRAIPGCFFGMVAKHGNMKKMAGKQLVMAVNALLLSLAGLATTFQCCGFLLSLIMMQCPRQLARIDAILIRPPARRCTVKFCTLGQKNDKTTFRILFEDIFLIALTAI